MGERVIAVARRTHEEAALTREAMIDAAEHVFHEKGVARATLQDIACAAGVTRGAFYWHFKDKGELFRAMLDRVRLPFDELVERIPENERPERELELIRRAGLLAIKHMEEPRFGRVHGILFHHCEPFDDIDPVSMMREMFSVASAQTLRRFRRAEAAGELRPKIDAETTNAQFHCLMRGLVYTWHVESHGFSLSEQGGRMLDQWFGSIARGRDTDRDSR